MSYNSFPSKSEDQGISILQNTDINIYSVGISTAGFAEIRMAKLLDQRKVTATTIDTKGAEFSRELIRAEDLEDQISIKLEDVSKPLPHKDSSFDFVYARLVLHYLSKTELDNALNELHRILKPKGKIYIVVLSTDCPIAKTPGACYKPSTGLTTITSKWGPYTRYFHTEQSIKAHIEGARFSIDSMRMYDELLCRDYERKQPSKTPSSLIETVAIKP